MMIDKFSKKDLLQSKKYRSMRDIINALLDNDKSYSIKEVDKIINNFLKKGV